MADAENQTIPLAPAAVRSDEQQLTTTAIFTRRKHHKSNKSLVYLLATVVFLGTIFLILASVFLRVDNPKLRLRTISVQNFQYDTNSTSMNITLLTAVTVNNKNFGPYVFENCNAVALYGNSSIGGGDISGGRVGAKRTKSISVTMRIGSENLNFSSGGSHSRNQLIEITSYAKMTGRVHVTKIVNRRKTIEMNCTISLNLTSRSFVHSLCN